MVSGSADCPSIVTVQPGYISSVSTNRPPVGELASMTMRLAQFANLRVGPCPRLFPRNATATADQLVEIQWIAIPGPGRIQHLIVPAPNQLDGPFGWVKRIEAQHVRDAGAAQPGDLCR